MKEQTRKILIRAALSVGTLVIVFTLAWLFLVKTATGTALIARLITPLTGGDIRVIGLSGDLPNHIRAEAVEFSDADGVWLRVENVTLDWRALALLNNHVDIARLEADRTLVLRRQRTTETSESTLVVDIASLKLPRIEIAAAAIGEAATLSAEGSVHYANSSDVAATITANQLNGSGQYLIDASIRENIVRGTINITETNDGVAGRILGLTQLGPMRFDARGDLEGQQNRIYFDLSAGNLTATGQGAINLTARTAAIDFLATSPEMALRPDLSWSALYAKGTMRGAFSAPRIAASLQIESLVSGEVRADIITGAVKSEGELVDAALFLNGITLPGNAPRLLAGSPLRLNAQLDLTKPARPVAFNADHPLIKAQGTANLAGPFVSQSIIDLPSLAGLRGLLGEELAGSAHFTVSTTESGVLTSILANGRIDAQGNTPAARLLGREAAINLTLRTDGTTIASATGEIQAAALRGTITGATTNNVLNYRWDLAVSDVSRAVATLRGNVNLRGTLAGRLGEARVIANGEANLATEAYEPQRISIGIDARNLPRFDTGSLRLSGRFENAPVDLRLDLTRNTAGALTATLQPTEWKGINARGKVTLAQGNTPLQGDLNLRIAKLESVAPLIGITASGALDADIILRADKADITARGRAIAFNDMRAAQLNVTGAVNDPFGAGLVDLDLTAEGLAAQGFTGRAVVELQGPLNATKITLNSDLANARGEALKLNLAATSNTANRSLTFASATADWRGETVRLAGPSTLSYANGISFDRLRLEQDGARAEFSGSLTPGLAATLTLADVPGETLRLAAPDFALDGIFSGTARLTGSLAAPEAAFDIEGNDIRPKGITTRGFTDTTLKARGTLRNNLVTFESTLSGGKQLELAISGSAALSGLQELNITAKGNTDLAMLNPVFTVGGQSLAGVVTLGASVRGTLTQPIASGSATLSNGEYRDYGRGIRLQAIEASLTAQGDVIRISQMTSRAGNGTISGSGTINIGVPGMPVDITFNGRNARPLASDLVTATVNADGKLTGNLTQNLTLSGIVDVLQGEIKIPDKLPPQVAVLDVRRKGQAPPESAASRSTMTLDLTVVSQGRTFVRGRGIDVDLDGSLKITGSVAQPVVLGGLDMRRGTLSIAGRTLSFTSGKVSFDGAGLRNRIDPTLDLAAETTSAGITAKLAITGYASAPKVILSSTPTLAQDEIIARLLFQTSVKQLTPLQLAEIAQAIAALGGVGTGFNPVGTLRQSLGLDRLSIGSTPSSTGEQSTATIDVGKYITRNVYVGATQDFQGRTKAVVEVDIIKNLKAQATVNAGTGPAATTGSQAGQGDSIGLSYQFDY